MLKLSRDEQITLAFLLAVAAFIVVGIALSRAGQRPRTATPIVVTKPSHGRPAATIIVHVSGEVYRPDVYELPAGSRVRDALVLAEPKPGAEPDRLNLAAVLTDGEKIVVPKAGAPTAQTRAAVYMPKGTGKININTASQKELETLHGIGPVLASRIIEHRRHHPFKRLEDIMRVRGIGNKTFAKIKDAITVADD